MRHQPQTNQGPIATLVPFPGGLKAYVEDPTRILDHRPDRCAACGRPGALHVHACRPRLVSIDNQRVLTVAYDLRCPGCWATTRLLPVGVLPGVTYSVETVATAIQTYLEPATSYRSVAADMIAGELPEGLTRSTLWGNAKLSSPVPSTVFRWVARFATGAGAWWPPVTASTQDRLPHPLTVTPAPAYLAAKARTEPKHQALATACALLGVLWLLTGLLGEPARRWPYTLLGAWKFAPPLDHTRWFAVPSRAPP